MSGEHCRNEMKNIIPVNAMRHLEREGGGGNGVEKGGRERMWGVGVKIEGRQVWGQSPRSSVFKSLEEEKSGIWTTERRSFPGGKCLRRGGLQYVVYWLRTHSWMHGLVLDYQGRERMREGAARKGSVQTNTLVKYNKNWVPKKWICKPIFFLIRFNRHAYYSQTIINTHSASLPVPS